MLNSKILKTAILPIIALLWLFPGALPAAGSVELIYASGIDDEDVSGNNQIGTVSEYFQRPLRVRVVDENGDPVPGVLLEFVVVEAEGAYERDVGAPSVDSRFVESGPMGYASTNVRSGSEQGTFHVAVFPRSEEGRFLVFTLHTYRQNWAAFTLVGLVGGLAIFLFGIRFSGRGLQKAAGGKLRQIVARLTANRFLGVITGIVVTIIIQSSSATTAMMVSFANAGLMALSQAMGVILGADIGTTLTVQLIAFRIFDYALLIVAAGFVLLVSKVERYSRIGQIIMGFGLLFFGMSVMSLAVAPARNHPGFTQFILGVERSPMLAIVAAAVFTAIIQSSAATIGLVLTFAFQGMITLGGAIPLVLGANIGTCATALLASMGSTPEGKRIAWAHTFFKVVAVALLFPFLGNFTNFVQGTSGTLTRQIANAHTLFNVGAALLFLPFVKPWAHLFRFLIKEEEAEAEVFRPVYLDPRVLETPALALGQATRETLRMADITYRMYSRSIDVFLKNDEALRAKLIEEDDKVDTLDEAITPYLTMISQSEMSDDEAQQGVCLLFIVHNIELIGDIVSKSLMDLALKKMMVSPRFSQEALEDIKRYHGEVEKTLQMAIDTLASRNKRLAEDVVERKSELNNLEREIHKKHLLDLSGNREEVAETSTIFLDVLNDLKRINSNAAGIAYAVLGRL
jgi:phosphate:Na+ symporter